MIYLIILIVVALLLVTSVVINFIFKDKIKSLEFDIKLYIGRLTTTINNANLVVEELSKTNAELDSQRKAVNVLEVNNSTLKKEYNSLKSAYNSLKSAYNDLKSTYDNLTKPVVNTVTKVDFVPSPVVKKRNKKQQ